MSAGAPRGGRTTNGPTRVVVVDDHVLLTSLLVDWLSRHGFDARGVFGHSDHQLISAIAAADPDVVLLDDHLGEELGTAERFVAPAIELGALVVMLTSDSDRVLQARCVEQGASGFLHKRARPAELVAAVEAVVEGRSLLTPSQRSGLIVDLRRARSADQRRRAPFASLTEREGQVLVAICDGDSAAEIAASWDVSVATVRSHIRAVLHKLDAGSQLEAAAMARRAGWPWGATREETTGTVISDDHEPAHMNDSVGFIESGRGRAAAAWPGGSEGRAI